MPITHEANAYYTGHCRHRTLPSPQKETPSPLAVIPFSPQSLTTTDRLSVSMDLIDLGISHKWNSVTCPFVSGCFHSASCLQDFSTWEQVSLLHFFFMATTSVDNIFTYWLFWILCIMLLWTMVYKYLFESIFSSSAVHTQEWNCWILWVSQVAQW